MNKDYQEHELTAYLLDELDEQRAKEIEEILGNSESARQKLAELQEAMQGLCEAFADEPAIGLTADQQAELQAEFEKSRQVPLMSNGKSRVRLTRWALPLAAAASLIVVFVLSWNVVNYKAGFAPSKQAEMRPLSRLDKTQVRPAVPGPAGAERQTGPAVRERAAANEQSTDEGTVRYQLARTQSDQADKRKKAVPNAPAAVTSGVTDRLAAREIAGVARSDMPGIEEFKESDLTIPGRLPAAPPSAQAPAKDRRVVGGVAGGVVGGVVTDTRSGVNATFAVVPANKEEEQFNTEAYDYQADNEMTAVAKDPLSTFSIDVDTASYSNVRRFLREGRLPPPDAVRIEEMINYFPYSYEPPHDRTPFAVETEVAQAPWALDHRLIRIAMKGRDLPPTERPDTNLVFLLDVSGSMDSPVKLPLVKQAMRLLVDKLENRDRVAIVVYAGSSGLVLPSTSGGDKQRILDAIEQLEAGGSTNGAAGIQLAYREAMANFKPNGINRVILATDGDFNVGVTNQGELVRLVQDEAAKGIGLTALGFGMGNYKDSMLEKLADKGDGNYAYIDSLDEARKVLVEQMGGTLVTIAKDVKIQVEFNPLEVTAYRLIGYENRVMAHQDFDNDRKDAGEIGAGHTITALYEVVPSGVPVYLPDSEPLKYQRKAPTRASRGELLTVKLRYKLPNEETSRKLEVPVVDSMRFFNQASDDFRFAAAVAGFGMILRNSPFKGSATFQSIMQIADTSRHFDPQGYRAEFVRLVGEASRIAGK